MMLYFPKNFGQERSTIGSHRNADNLLKNSASKFNNYTVFEKLEHSDLLFLYVAYILQTMQNHILLKTINLLRNVAFQWRVVL